MIQEISPELAEQVLTGTKPFDAAYKEAQEMRKERKAAEAKKARLKEEAEDLLALVDEERMPLNEAVAALDARGGWPGVFNFTTSEQLFRQGEAPP